MFKILISNKVFNLEIAILFWFYFFFLLIIEYILLFDISTLKKK